MHNKPRLKFGVVGIQHDHIACMTRAVEEGGGQLTLFYTSEPEVMAEFGGLHPDARPARSEAEVLENEEISLIVSAIIPSERAQLGVRVMRAGKDYMADKGGFLSLEDLEAARRVQAETKRIYSVSYNEQMLLPACVRAGEMVRAGAIGRVVQMIGIAPHGLYGHGPRPPWFWTRAARGGILCDIGTHQCADFLHYTGAARAHVVAAHTANHANPDHPDFEDWGEMLLSGDTATGYARVDFYEGNSLGFRLTLLGTEGSMEVMKHERRIVLATRTEKRRIIEVENFICPYGERLVNDVLDRTETAMPQWQTFLASELAVHAQQKASAR